MRINIASWAFCIALLLALAYAERLIKFVPAGGAASSSGCNAWELRRQVAPGMTEGDVRSALGDPARTQSDSRTGYSVETWYFDCSNGSVQVQFSVDRHVIGASIW